MGAYVVQLAALKHPAVIQHDVSSGKTMLATLQESRLAPNKHATM